MSAKERGSPRYLIGNWDIAVGKSAKITVRSMSSHLIGEIILLTIFVTRPLTSPNSCRAVAKLEISSDMGTNKIAASSA